MDKIEIEKIKKSTKEVIKAIEPENIIEINELKWDLQIETVMRGIRGKPMSFRRIKERSSKKKYLKKKQKQTNKKWIKLKK